MNRYLEKIAEKSAVIVTGNPKFIRNAKARSFYDDLQSHLESKGYTVTRDPGKAFTKPVDADLWVAHSKGVNRLKFAPPGTKTIAIGAPEVKGSITHPEDIAVGGEKPTAAHFTLTPDMKAAIDNKLIAPNFKALAAGPKGSLHTALGVDPSQHLPEDLLAHAAEHHEDPAIRTRAQMVLEIKRWRASKNKYLEKVAETWFRFS